MSRRVVGVLALISAAAGIGVAAVLVQPSLVWVFVAIGAISASVPFAAALVRRQFDIFEPIYLFSFSYAVLFVFRPIFDLSSPDGPPPVLGYSVKATYALALAIGLAGLWAFYVGYSGRIGIRLSQRFPAPGTVWADSTLTVIIIAAFLVSLALYTLFVFSSGGVAAFSSILSGRNPVSQAALIGGSGYLYSAPLWLTGLGVLVLARARSWWSPTGCAGFGLVGYSQLTHAALGDRAFVLPALAALGVLWYMRRSRRPSLLEVTVGLLFIFLVAVVAPRQYRQTLDRNQGFAQTVVNDLTHPLDAFGEFFQNPDTIMASDLAVELQFVPDTIHYQLGATYLEAAVRPIPRSVWPGKPANADTQLMKVIWPEWDALGVGFSFSIFGEPYLNLGVAGVLIFSFLFGAGSKGLFEWFAANSRNHTVMTLYALSWPFILVYMRGGVGEDYHRQLIFVVPVLIAWIMAQKHTQRAGTSISRPISPFISANQGESAG